MFTGQQLCPAAGGAADLCFHQQGGSHSKGARPSILCLCCYLPTAQMDKENIRQDNNKPKHLGVEKNPNPLPHPPFFLFLFSFKSISQWAEIITNNKCPPGWIKQTRALWNYIGNNDPAQHNLPKFHTHQIKWHPCKYIQYQQMTANCYCSQRWKDTEQCENTAIISCTLSPWTGTCSSNFFLVSLNPNDSLGLVLTKCLSGNHDLSAFITNTNLLKYDQANAASMGKT